MAREYNHQEVERKWQAAWERDGVYHVSDSPASASAYVLDMFPYPSAQGLHVGHPEGYTASDIYSRYLRARGTTVLHPMGFDAFGLPAENYAIKTGTHPAKTTKENIDNMRQQIKRLGFSYDWEREVITSDPRYYKWTQWIFVQLFKHGLAYEAAAPINWCPKDKTGLANEEVIDGKCERCGTPVTKKQIKQWLVKITDEKYIERLLHGLDNLDWPESIKTLQRNWIGRSEGAEIDFNIVPQLPKKVVLLHGFQGDPDTGWKAWLIPLLQQAGVEVHAPKLPGDDKPQLERHLEIIDELGVDKDTVIIGHSLGCATALEYIQQRKAKVGHVILVAPPLPSARLAEAGAYPAGVQNYSTWSFDASAIKRLAARRTIIADLHDDKVSLPEPRQLAQDIEAELLEEVAPRPHFANRGIGPFAAPIIANAVAPGLTTPIRVFTTRPDTLFGATYMVLSPEHELVDVITTEEQRTAVEQYKEEAAAKSDLERTELTKYKSGVDTGAKAINPMTGKPISIWIAEYVLSSYGTGAIMAVPAHDQRDFEFAKRHNLEVIPVILPPRHINTDLDFAVPPPLAHEIKPGESVMDIQLKSVDTKIEMLKAGQACYPKEGVMINSGMYNHMESADCRRQMLADLEKKGVGKKAVNYKLRDWLFSRQRYWGEPIPIVHCEKCGNVAVPEDQLPLELPNVEKYEPTGTGESPLAAISDWVNTTCPECGGSAKRETNTMPQWAGSNWYWLRYCDPHNDTQLADPEKLKQWLPVNMYIGGAEHAVLHLLYARFIYMFLYDIGTVPQECGEEPFAVLKNQGLIMGEDGQKMSKSRGNVINPDDVVDKYGADVLRMYEMFMGPFEDAKPWSTQGIVGIRRFVEKVWDVGARTAPDAAASDDVLVHGTIKSITEKIEQFRFNTCISDLMKWSNAWSGPVNQSEFEIFIMLLAPFAPHLAQELWSQLGHDSYIAQEQWPAYDEFKIVETEITYAIQVNGKVRDTITVPAATDEQGTIQIALQQEKVQKHLKGEPKKTIFVKDKLVNFVT